MELTDSDSDASRRSDPRRTRASISASAGRTEVDVKLVLSTDARNPSELGFMRYAVEQTRRGWLEPTDILNTRSLDSLRAALRRL